MALIKSVVGGLKRGLTREKRESLLDLIGNLIATLIEMVDASSEKNDSLTTLTQMMCTIHVRLCSRNRMLYWCGQYWEKSHSVRPGRVRSEHLVKKKCEEWIAAALVRSWLRFSLIVRK